MPCATTQNEVIAGSVELARWLVPSKASFDAIQPGTIHGNLVVYLVGLTNDALNVLVLGVHFFTHGATKMVEAFSRTMKRIY